MPGFLKLKENWRNLRMSEEKAQAEKDARDAYFNKPKTSYRLRYTGPEPPLANGSRIHLVPLPGKHLHKHLTPVQIQKDVCPTCQSIHTVKTVHLWIDANNTVLVSHGVKELIEQDYPGGLAGAELEVDGGTTNPPPLTLSNKTNRRQVDQANEAITHWSNHG